MATWKLSMNLYLHWSNTLIAMSLQWSSASLQIFTIANQYFESAHVSLSLSIFAEEKHQKMMFEIHIHVFCEMN